MMTLLSMLIIACLTLLAATRQEYFDAVRKANPRLAKYLPAGLVIVGSINCIDLIREPFGRKDVIFRQAEWLFEARGDIINSVCVSVGLIAASFLIGVFLAMRTIVSRKIQGSKWIPRALIIGSCVLGISIFAAQQEWR